MSTTIKYEFLKVIRNKRFIMFTLVAPLFFYVLLYSMSSSGGAEAKAAMSAMLAVLCSTFATVGSGINTLSSRIAREKPYIGNILVTTPYTPSKFIIITSAVQILLNVFIEAVIILFGALFFKLQLTRELFIMEAVILYLSTFYVLLGLCLGFVLETVTLQALSFPIYFAAMATNVTQQMYPGMPGFITTIQRAFPGFYATKMISNISDHAQALSNLAILSVYIVLMLIVTLVVYRYKKTSIVGA
ncbi:ABC transporter permease [Clostridium manihotivorum]|uniref:ABC-2 type transporter transmembrane domain-containing protein n=1 Tax=Clostridium manihotivorum TaxID=2320868 RepID=A0A410DPM9_9CLOT|nr:ABC transporter permease [Clostridium manihotivorum]QAA31123.1 hypothetical protein C1I91_05280 [Clostridium manihotivorum]